MTVFALPFLILVLPAGIAFFVLFIMLCIKKPKAAVILLLVPIAVVTLFSITSVVYVRNREIQNRQQATTRLLELRSEPIWSEGIEDEFITDVYPSKESAIRSIGVRIGEQFQHVTLDSVPTDTIVIYKDSLVIDSLNGLRDTILKLYPDMRCRIENSVRYNLQNNEIGIHLRNPQDEIIHPFAVYGDDFHYYLDNGTIEATISNQNRSTTISVPYSNKPWIENFAGFLNSQPNKQFIIARSSESCLTAEEANEEAINDAFNKVYNILSDSVSGEIALNMNQVTDNLVVDKFAQSFDGSSSKIWRQAMLLDVSSNKLRPLLAQQRDLLDVQRNQWVRTIFSVIGLLILITIVYAFLNAATKGYYEWSLRIAGFLIGILVLLFVLFMS